MYDSKKEDKKKNEDLKFSSVYDRGYFNKVQGEGILTTKTSFVPCETIFFSDKV